MEAAVPGGLETHSRGRLKEGVLLGMRSSQGGGQERAGQEFFVNRGRGLEGGRGAFGGAGRWEEREGEPSEAG